MDLDSAFVAKDTLVSVGNSVEISVFVPVVDFLKLELPGIEIVVGSLVDCEGFADTFRSLISPISSYEEQFCTDFSGKSVLLVALLKELLFSLGCNVSEMLEESI